jgi:hypothetical protein
MPLLADFAFRLEEKGRKDAREQVLVPIGPVPSRL